MGAIEVVVSSQCWYGWRCNTHCDANIGWMGSIVDRMLRLHKCCKGGATTVSD